MERRCDRYRLWLLGLRQDAALSDLRVINRELTQARRELAAIDEALGEFYCPVLDPETEEPSGSYFLDHGVHIMRMELERLQKENDGLRSL